MSVSEHQTLLIEALETARHELVATEGLIVVDGAAPDETFTIEHGAAIAKIDEALTMLGAISGEAAESGNGP